MAFSSSSPQGEETLEISYLSQYQASASDAVRDILAARYSALRQQLPSTPPEVAAKVVGEEFLSQLLMLLTSRPQPSLPTSAAHAQLPIDPRLIHACSAQGCRNHNCRLCRNCAERVCATNLKPQYIEGEQLRAPCGQVPTAILVDTTTGNVCTNLPEEYYLELHLISDRRYNEACNGNPQCSDDDLDRCVAADAEQLAGVLKLEDERRPGAKAAVTPPKAPPTKIELPLKGGIASLAGVSCEKSSRAVVKGRDAAFRLVVFVMAGRPSSGKRVPGVSPLVSEAFAVVTRRAKSGLKPEFPLLHKDATQLKNIGGAIYGKLAALPPAFQAFTAQWPHTQGDVKESACPTVAFVLALGEYAADNSKVKPLLRHLGMEESAWQEALTHAHTAVAPDATPRLWLDSNGLMGLLFGFIDTAAGLLDWRAPTHFVQRTTVADPLMPTPLCQVEPDLWRPMLAEARQDWDSQDHPGWSVLGEAEHAEPAASAAEDAEAVTAAMQMD